MPVKGRIKIFKYQRLDKGVFDVVYLQSEIF